MRSEFWFDSCGAGKIHCCKWIPEGCPKGVVQIVHGIAEFVERYDDFAVWLNRLGYAVVAEDHMGHGQSINGDGIQGYFHGGWFSAVEDTYHLLQETRKEYPDIPYILFGHSMGSFMARTILCRYPDSGISGAVICGTAWQPTFAMPAVTKMMEMSCRKIGETVPSPKLQNLIFGSYNSKIEHPRTPYDWLSRDKKIVDDYIAHPLCGFTVCCGLLRDMMQGIYYIQKPEHLDNMQKELPVFFIAGGDDPVGSYGKGVHQAADTFQKAGMKDVSIRIYPLCRHEILNEINREEIFEDVLQWMEKNVLRTE